MKSIDLMIGDWVYVAHRGSASHFGKVSALLPSGAVETEIEGAVGLSSSVDPIPLTPEILEKNGFVKTIHQDLYKNTYLLDRFFIHEHHNKVKFPYCWIDLGDTDIKYVHELQHALRLCGIKKEIVL